MSTTLLHIQQQHHPHLSSPPSSFTPPRSPRQPVPSPPPSPSPRKGKNRSLVNVVPVPHSERHHHEDGDDEASSTNNSPSKPSTSARRRTNGRKPSVDGLVREERLKGDAGRELTELSEGEEENGWGWEEEHLWGENFWVTLQDLATNAIFFANPRTGECSWQPPNGVYVLPIPPTGQWWCLNDPQRSNLPYFYHTLSRETRWIKPDVPLIIPLASIQMNTLGAPPSKSFQRRRSASALAAPPPNSSASLLSSSSFANSTFNPSPSKMRTSTLTRTQKSSAPPSTTHGRGGIHQQSFSAAAEELKGKPVVAGSTPMELRNNSSGSGKGTPEKSSSGGGGVLTMGRRIRERAMSGPMAPPAEPSERPKLERLRTDLKGRNIGEPSLDLGARTRMSPVDTSSTDGPVVVPPSINTKRFSTGEHRILPTELSSEIQQFSVKEFADRFFSTSHTQGLLWRKKVPVDRMVVWQKAAITTPLLTLSSPLKSTAVKCFKVIQRAMGERERVVDVPTLSASSSSSSSNGHGLAGAKNSPPPMLTDREVMLGEVRWMLSVGITHLELRDEIFSQLVKQLSQNPNLSCVFRGWELLSVIVVTFSPSRNFAEYLKTFIKATTRSTDQTDEIGARVQIMASHCLERLLANKPPKGKAPTVLEIESAMGAAFNPSVFGSTLTQTLQVQSELYPDDRVPIILPFLANGILALGGACTEGIFRVPGDGDGVAMLKDRIDRGQYQLSGVDDPNIPASLFKLWLRELQEPLIPPTKYNAALAVAGDPDAVCDLIRTLPRINRAVVVFTISFLQLLLAHQTETKMTEMNLATIFAPNLLRCPADASLPEAFTVASAVPTQFVNSAFERSFVLNLLRRLVPEEIDDYIPRFGVPPSSPPRQRNGTA
ncbi:hypothetical protein BDY24DRAFT_382457 [Mrakia frigida]|uniref:uncharacterized protein n=1 Tax=Mrakia frigida TaxID=29902 RepID=UPI003FCC1DC3